jgi:hypothetical protein
MAEDGIEMTDFGNPVSFDDDEQAPAQEDEGDTASISTAGPGQSSTQAADDAVEQNSKVSNNVVGADKAKAEENKDFMNPFQNPLNQGKTTFDKVMPAVTGALAAGASAAFGPGAGLAVAAVGTGVSVLVDSLRHRTPVPTPPPSPRYNTNFGEAAPETDGSAAPTMQGPTLDNETDY